MGDPKDMGNPKEIDQFLPFEEEPIKTRYKAKSVVKLGTVFCTFLILAWLAWLTFDKKDVIPVRSDQDLIMKRILEDKMVEMDRVMESVRAMKEGINATGFRQMRSVGTFANPVKVMSLAGEKLVQTMGIVKDVIMAPLQAAIDALEEQIRNVQNRIDGLTEEQKRRIPKALRKLSQVQRDLIITRERLVNLAASTIKRVNSLIRVISKIGRRSRRVEIRVRIMLRKFDSLLENSKNMLKTASDDYISMSDAMIAIRSDLVYFGESVMQQAERMEKKMDNWISKTQAAVYGGCVAAILIPWSLPVCYAIAAATLETKIAEYRAEIAHLKAMSRDSSQESLKLAEEAKRNKKYIEEEMILIDKWISNVKIVHDQFTDTGLSTGEIDLLQYIELEGKNQTVQMLCDLSEVCTQYMDHKLKFAAYKGDIPQQDTPPQHPLCTEWECKKPSILNGANPPTIETVKLADIQILASLGDSLSAAAEFEDDARDVWAYDYEEEDDEPAGTLIENKRISFVTGSVVGLKRQTTLFNVLQHFNPTLLGGSSGSTRPGSSPSAIGGLNFATTGAKIRDAEGQAQKFITALRKRKEMVDKWKLVTLQFGIGDLCSAPAVEEWTVYLRQALTTLRDKAGKTIVLLLTPFDVGSLLRPECDASRSLHQCSWINNGDQCRTKLQENKETLETILSSTAQQFRTMTFAVEVLPTLTNFKVDLATSDDCLHPDKPHLSMIGKNLWNNFVSPAALRTSVYDDSLALHCPNADSPLPLTLPASPKSVPRKSEGADVFKLTVTEKSNDYIQVEFKTENGQTCTTGELNIGGQMWTEVKGRSKVFNFKNSVLNPLDANCQKTLSAGTLYFRLTTQRQKGNPAYDQICVDQVELDMSRKKFVWRGRTSTCAKGKGDWKKMTVEHATCGAETP